MNHRVWYFSTQEARRAKVLLSENPEKKPVIVCEFFPEETERVKSRGQHKHRTCPRRILSQKA